MTLLVTGAGLYAGGLGGVARYTPDAGWVLMLSGLSLRTVTVLTQGGGVLLAGGDSGIGQSLDGGQSWRRRAGPAGTATIAALALLSNSEEGTALAGTLGSGVLRSSDGGASWQSANFGLGSLEVLALTWGAGESAIAATADGLFRSPNGGRAWRGIPATAGRAFVAITVDPQGRVLAAPEVGPPWEATDDLVHWRPFGDLAGDIQTSAMIALGDGRILLGTASHGLLRSEDGGTSWSEVSASNVLCFAADEARVFAGTETGVLLSQDSGETWHDLPLPPLHDLRRIHVVNGTPFVCGCNSSPVIFDPHEGWTVCSAMPLPLLGFFPAPDRALFASSPDGLFLSRDQCASWSGALSDQEGSVTQMTFGSAGCIWSGLTPEGALLRSGDGGNSWQRLPSPFGVLPLIALQAVIDPADQGVEELFAVTYDERQRAAAIWRSRDGGTEWSREANIPAPWPVAITSGDPPLVAVSNAITVQQPNGEWRQTTLADRGFRQVASNASVIQVLGTDALWRSDDHGVSWTRDDMDLPIDQVLDIALDADTLYALLTAGRLWSRRL